ncbi:uncharacterized protein G2W53_031203 [Senna tora]|uniref:Uncharacterized protein n=1 Tax=Senna tora TaxID=362788 RepID=A0A834WHI4_9FABA|nr:uncharacterized protein G2W53_031203 [Senna tora]
MDMATFATPASRRPASLYRRGTGSIGHNWGMTSNRASASAITSSTVLRAPQNASTINHNGTRNQLSTRKSLNYEYMIRNKLDHMCSSPQWWAPITPWGIPSVTRVSESRKARTRGGSIPSCIRVLITEASSPPDMLGTRTPRIAAALTSAWWPNRTTANASP